MSEEVKIKKEEIHVDRETVLGIYERLENLTVELDENPIEFGPRRLTAKVAQTRNMLSECQRVFTQVSKFMWEVKSSILRDETVIQAKTNILLANDPSVRARPSVSDRKALVQVLLSEEIDILEEKKQRLLDLQMLTDTLKAKIKDLVDVQARLNSQIRLCKLEIESLQVKWGSKDPEVSLELEPDPSVSGLRLDDFLRLGDNDEESVQLPPKQELVTEILREGTLKGKEQDLTEINKTPKGSLSEVARNSMLINLNSVGQDDNLMKALETSSEDEEADQFLDLIEDSETASEIPVEREEDDLEAILSEL